MKFSRFIAPCLVIIGMAFPEINLLSQSKLPFSDASDYSFKLELKNVIKKGSKWLLEQQDPAGFWSDSDHPAITGFALFALLNDPALENIVEKRKGQIDKGIAFLLSKIQPDGGVYTPGQGLANYNTSLAIMAMTAVKDPSLSEYIKSARRFIVRGQFDFGEKGVVDTNLDGGVGYGNSYPHSDMSNTLLALEALRYSEAYRGEAVKPGVNDLNWEAAIEFISKCQNNSETNKEPWVSDEKGNKGGFVYFPGNTKSDKVKLSDGRVALRSYGSISYAGLLSLVYAKLNKDDKRVLAVQKWLSENYTLDENPGMGQQGLFYYFHTMSKALTASETHSFKDAQGKEVHWKKELALKLMDLQKQDGSWINPTSRWWENDPVLVTSYSLVAIELIHNKF